MILSTLFGPKIHIKTLKWGLFKNSSLAEALRLPLRRKSARPDFPASEFSLLQTQHCLCLSTPALYPHQEDNSSLPGQTILSSTDIKPRALYMLGKLSTSELYSQTFCQSFRIRKLELRKRG